MIKLKSRERERERGFVMNDKNLKENSDKYRMMEE